LSAVSTYAQALFEAAREREEIEESLENLKEFLDVLHESDELGSSSTEPTSPSRRSGGP
jgi:F-type H+-transporting ATPase subunit delta